MFVLAVAIAKELVSSLPAPTDTGAATDKPILFSPRKLSANSNTFSYSLKSLSFDAYKLRGKVTFQSYLTLFIRSIIYHLHDCETNSDEKC